MGFVDFLNFYLVPGILLGSIYAVGAIGITLVFGILRFAHLAHGDMATLGAYLVLGAMAIGGLNPWLALPLAMAIAALLAVLLDKAFYDYLRERPRIPTVVASLGVALMLRPGVPGAWGGAPLSHRTIVFADEFLGERPGTPEIYTLLAVVGIVFGLELFLFRTRWGKAMRAMSDNPDLARLSGIDIRQVTTMTWILVGALTAASGFFLGINTELTPMMGWFVLLPMFAAAILGGVGKVWGAVLGGLVVGIAEELSVLVMPAAYKSATAFVILLAILLLRPRGLLNGKVL